LRKGRRGAANSASATPIGGILQLLHTQYGETFTLQPGMLTRASKRRMVCGALRKSATMSSACGAMAPKPLR